MSYRQFLLGVCSRIGCFPSRQTPVENLNRLLDALKPRCINQSLVRIGPDKDGGYLLPDDLDGIKACFSPGVSFESGFEKDCADRGMNVFLADKSVDGPSQQHPLFHFTKKFVGCSSTDAFITLDDWVASCISELESDLLLQMDIEGYEYEVLLSASARLMESFRFMVIEFHSLDQLFGRAWFNIASRAFYKILQTHFCVHIHPNNCCGVTRVRGLTIPRVMEFTFVRRDRYEPLSRQTAFPHPLDVDNTSKKPVVLPPCWYGHT